MSPIVGIKPGFWHPADIPSVRFVVQPIPLTLPVDTMLENPSEGFSAGCARRRVAGHRQNLSEPFASMIHETGYKFADLTHDFARCPGLMDNTTRYVRQPLSSLLRTRMRPETARNMLRNAPPLPSHPCPADAVEGGARRRDHHSVAADRDLSSKLVAERDTYALYLLVRASYTEKVNPKVL